MTHSKLLRAARNTLLSIYDMLTVVQDVNIVSCAYKAKS
jgi:hypothetical protein